MKNKIAVIVTLVLVAVLVVSLFPWITRVDMTLDVVKLDADGQAVGDFKIHLRGNLANYLFRDDTFVLSIAGFDGLSDIHVSHEVQTDEGKLHANRFCRITGSAWTGDVNAPAVVDIGFDEDMDRWVLCLLGEDICYVGSVSGSYSAEELAEYFAGLTPLRWFYDSE